MARTSGDQTTDRLFRSISRVLFFDRRLDIEWRALALIERSDALIQFGAQSAQLFDVRQELSTDLLLIGFRKTAHFRDGAFEDLGHDHTIANRGSITHPLPLAATRGTTPGRVRWWCGDARRLRWWRRNRPG